VGFVVWGRNQSSWLSLPKKIKPPKRRLNFFGGRSLGSTVLIFQTGSKQAKKTVLI